MLRQAPQSSYGRAADRHLQHPKARVAYKDGYLSAPAINRVFIPLHYFPVRRTYASSEPTSYPAAGGG